jgi:DNA-binding PadR family transcriptional regulator
MPSRTYLGELELFVLAAVQRLGDAAYGVTIRREISSSTGRAVSIGSVYGTLGRLGDKGLVTFSVSEPLAVQGGRARRMTRLTPAGVRALLHAIESLSRLTYGTPAGARL